MREQPKRLTKLADPIGRGGVIPCILPSHPHTTRQRIGIPKGGAMVNDCDGDGEHGLKIYQKEIRKVPVLSKQDEIKLAARIKHGDAAARNQMIKANLRLVVKITHDYANRGLPLLDLVAKGNIGLIRAVERFDPRKDGKLSTCAAWRIQQSIKHALANHAKANPWGQNTRPC